jgi:hypothetical protein
MRKVLLATVATVLLSTPFAASADEVIIRDHPRGDITVRDHDARMPRVREDRLYDRAAPGAVIEERVGPRRDDLRDR